MAEKNHSNGEEDLRPVSERLGERSHALAILWKFVEFSRIVSACVCFLGPWIVLVFWLIDFLQHTFDPGRYPDALKEWQFYVLLVLVFTVVGYLVAGSKYDRVIPFIWDDSRRTEHHDEIIRGLRQIAGVCDAIIVPRPGAMG